LESKFAPRVLTRPFRRALDAFACSPLVRWTWGGLSESSFSGALVEFRPADGQMIDDMLIGRYVLAGRLVETGGHSPFAFEPPDLQFEEELDSFSWLRHFAASRSPEHNSFARMLVLDWITRNGRFNSTAWGHRRTALRIMNWMRHLPLVMDGATRDQARTISRALSAQIQMLRTRRGLAPDPAHNILAALALAAASLCTEAPSETIRRRLSRLMALLGAQIGRDGMHLSRNPAVQVEILTELASIRLTLSQHSEIDMPGLVPIADRMHGAIDLLTLPTGEPAFFNGAGPMPVDLVMALQAQSLAKRPQGGTVGGYARLADGRSALIADSGQIPPPGLGRSSTASALALEFVHGGDLVFGSCGPALGGGPERRLAHRLGPAFSGPTIDGISSARLPRSAGPSSGLIASGAPPEMEFSNGEPSIALTCHAFEKSAGCTLVRRLSLLADGDTLVGRDRILAAGRGVNGDRLELRFHMAPRAIVEQEADGQTVRLTMQSGTGWSFMCEGASLELEESVRQTGHFGLLPTQMIVLTAPLCADHEIAWILTRQTG